MYLPCKYRKARYKKQDKQAWSHGRNGPNSIILKLLRQWFYQPKVAEISQKCVQFSSNRSILFQNITPPPPIFSAVLFLLSMIKQAVYQQNMKILIRTLRYKNYIKIIYIMFFRVKIKSTYQQTFKNYRVYVNLCP